jgi:hypothetical protein
MQRTLLGVIETRLRRSCGAPSDLVALLIEAYRSPHTMEARPGLRAAIEATIGLDMRERVHAVLAFLGDDAGGLRRHRGAGLKSRRARLLGT